MRRQVRREIPYDRNRIPRHLQHDARFFTDHGQWTTFDQVAYDEYGNSYDPRRMRPDVDHEADLIGRQGT